MTKYTNEEFQSMIRKAERNGALRTLFGMLLGFCAVLLYHWIRS